MTPRAVFPWWGSPERPAARIKYRVDTETRSVGRELDAVHELDPRPRVALEEDVAVKVDVIAEACDVGGRRDSKSRLDHAAEHHAEPERSGGVCHADPLTRPSGLRQLDVDPVRALGAGRDVHEPVAVLVDEDREWRAVLQLGPVCVAGRQRLLAVLDAEHGELRKRLQRLVERPALVHVHLEWELGYLAHSADPLDVAAVPHAELELQALEPSV